MSSPSIDHFKSLQDGVISIKERLKTDRSTLSSEDGDRRTLLHAAALVGDLDAVNWLLKGAKSADLKKRDKKGSTALHLAAQQGHLDIYEAILKAGASPNSTDYDKLSSFGILCRYVLFLSILCVVPLLWLL